MVLLLVLLNFLYTSAAASQSEVLLSVEQPPDEVLGVVINADQVVAPLQLARHDLLVETHEAGVHEGRLAKQHLVHEDAQGPPVHGAGVAPTLENLRREVLGGSAHRVAHATHRLREPEVCDDSMTLGVKQDVLRLEVPVGDVEAVQIREAGHDLRGVELDRGGGESVVHPHEGEQLTPRLEREQEVEVVNVLPAVGEAYQEGMVDFLSSFKFIKIVK